MFWINASFSTAIYLWMLFWYFLSKVFFFFFWYFVDCAGVCSCVKFGFTGLASSTLTRLLARLVYMSLKCFFMKRKAWSMQLQARTTSIKPVLSIMHIRCWSLPKSGVEQAQPTTNPNFWQGFQLMCSNNALHGIVHFPFIFLFFKPHWSFSLSLPVLVQPKICRFKHLNTVKAFKLWKIM